MREDHGWQEKYRVDVEGLDVTLQLDADDHSSVCMRRCESAVEEPFAS